ncbi:phospholipid/cholesterol/gamma-HCH transport system substrate-binding protein [Chitinophaga sp. CF118]|nr:phospholipid/cholesterol/gamma-HCH transport system substrate-binding protein [Chitinophaga sp. CF118]
MFKNNRPVILGIFVFLGLVILVITIFTLGNQKKTFVKSITINAVFDDVGGLLQGGNVWFSGVKVGTVKDISFYGDREVLVTMSIEKKAEAHIHKDAMAKIGSDGLIGNKIVIIYGGTATAPVAEKNSFLKVEKALTTDDMLATLQINNKNLAEITTSFKSIAKKIDSGNGALATILNDPAMAGKLTATINNLQDISDNFKVTSATSKTVLSDFRNFSGKLNRPGSSINKLVTDTTMYGDISGTLSELQMASGSISRFTANLKTMSDRLNEKSNAVGVLLNDSAAANSLKIIIKNLETSSQKLDEDLEAAQHNFLLRGFFKKKAKEK